MQNVGLVDRGVVSAWRNLKAEIEHAELAVPNTVQKILYLSIEV